MDLREQLIGYVYKHRPSETALAQYVDEVIEALKRKRAGWGISDFGRRVDKRGATGALQAGVEEVRVIVVDVDGVLHPADVRLLTAEDLHPGCREEKAHVRMRLEHVPEQTRVFDQMMSC